MERAKNPYRPGFGAAPGFLAGRDDLFAAAAEALESAALDAITPRPLLMIGPRGLGKTVTIRRVAELGAYRYAWPSVHVEVVSRRSLVTDVASAFEAAAELLQHHPPPRRKARVIGGKVGVGGFGVSGEVQWEHDRLPADQVDDGSRLAETLGQAMEAAVKRESGVILTLDEIQVSDRADLGVLGAALQQATREDAPLVVIAAGLPSVREVLREREGAPKPPTYFERAEWHVLAHLSPAESREALRRPARDAGRPLDDGAVERLLAVSGGYPFAIQVAGKYAWRQAVADGADAVTAAHADAALPAIRRDLATSLFESRWEGSSPEERAYLATLADLEAPSSNADVARAQSKKPNQTTYLKDRLTRKGTLVADPDTKELRFITPGMGEWIRARAE